MSDKKAPNSVDIQAGVLKLPDGYGPSSFVALGKLDGKAGISIGPSTAKTIANQIRRTITVHLTPIPAVEVPAAAFNKSLDEATKFIGGTITEVVDRTVKSRPAKQGLIRHRQGALAVVSLICVVGAPGYLWTILHSCLDEAAAIEELRGEYERLLESLDFPAA